MSSKRQQHIKHQYRCQGAFVELQQLLNQRHVAKSLEIDFQHHSRLGMAGSHISKTKGRGVDFEEHRAYQAGDDIRSIDWRVTARTGRPFTKIFREERERPVIIGVDQSHHMYFGSRFAFKSVTAAEVAAIIAWLTVDNGDRVGGVVFSDREHSLVKPRRSKRSALRFLDILANFNQILLSEHLQSATSGNNTNTDNAKPDNYFEAALARIYQITRPGSEVYLISDFRSMTERCLQYIQQLALHNNLTCLFIYDALEEQLPLPGVYNITDGRHYNSIDTHSKSMREQYQQNFAKNLEYLKNTFSDMKVPLLTLRTDDVILEKLEPWKHKTH